MAKHLKSTSKYLSLVLRHRPEAVGLRLDGEGWANIDDVVRLSGTYGRALSKELITEVVRTSDKQRFAISDDGNSIRANQGHSVEVDLNLPPSAPPDVLCHGTSTRFIRSIRSQGLLPGARQHVHLSVTQSAAIAVGKRHGKPTVLTIDALAMRKDGHLFYISINGVWLTREVPPQYITFSNEGNYE